MAVPFLQGQDYGKELTREVLQELIEKIYVYPDQQIDIYFRFRKSDSPGEERTEKEEVI